MVRFLKEKLEQYNTIINNPEISKEVGWVILRGADFITIDSKEEKGHVHETRYITGNKKEAIIEIWYNNTPPDYVFDSLKIIKTSNDPIRNYSKYKIKDK